MKSNNLTLLLVAVIFVLLLVSDIITIIGNIFRMLRPYRINNKNKSSKIQMSRFRASWV